MLLTAPLGTRNDVHGRNEHEDDVAAQPKRSKSQRSTASLNPRGMDASPIMHTCTDTCTHTCTDTCRDTCTHKCTHIYTHACTHRSTHRSTNTPARTHALTHAHRCTHMFTYKHIDAFSYIHTKHYAHSSCVNCRSFSQARWL